MRPSTRALSIVLLIVFSVGCFKTYYSFWEKLGKEKRDLLMGHVGKVRDDQEDAAEQFRDTLEKVHALYDIDGGELEKRFRKLESSYEEAEQRAETVRDRIDKLERIAEDLFAEWDEEIGSMSNPDFKSQSREKLNITKERFEGLSVAMSESEERMEPVLAQFRDQVLFLKHNLNAQAIAGLQGEVESIDIEVDSLIAGMESSMAEADRFIEELTRE